jgi:hypothetical protein
LPVTILPSLLPELWKLNQQQPNLYKCPQIMKYRMIVGVGMGMLVQRSGCSLQNQSAHHFSNKFIFSTQKFFALRKYFSEVAESACHI